MTRAAGSDALWALADALELVPTPPDDVLAARLADWWSTPRRFGCTSASAGATWTVVAPDLRIWCPSCAVGRFEAEWRCVYCGSRVARRRALALMFEMAGSVRVLARAHEVCSRAAARDEGWS